MCTVDKVNQILHAYTSMQAECIWEKCYFNFEYLFLNILFTKADEHAGNGGTVEDDDEGSHDPNLHVSVIVIVISDILTPSLPVTYVAQLLSHTS